MLAIHALDKVKREEKYSRLQTLTTNVNAIKDFYPQILNKEKRFFISIIISNGDISNIIELELKKEAFADLLQIFYIRAAALTHLNDVKERTREEFLNAFRRLAVQKKENEKINLHINKNTKEVFRITTENKAQKGIPTDSLFNAIEKLLDKNPRLNLDNYSINPNLMRMNFRAPDDQVWSISGIPKEEFRGGFTVIQDYKKGTMIFPYTNRVICSNGMIGDHGSALKITKTLDVEGWRSFYNHFKNLEKNQYKVPNFDKTVKMAINTQASYSELLYSANLLRSSSPNLDTDVELFYPLENIKSTYASKGINLDECTNNQLKTAGTPISCWENVQILTDFASNAGINHNYMLEASNATNIQQLAGKLLESPADMRNIVKINPFLKN